MLDMSAISTPCDRISVGADQMRVKYARRAHTAFSQLFLAAQPYLDITT
jgi:hypothetical protein